MKNFLGRMPYPVLIAVAVLLGLAPFFPQPHAVEKLRMLVNGTLYKPVDIFDLVMHLAPALLLMCKWLAERFSGRNDQAQ